MHITKCNREQQQNRHRHIKLTERELKSSLILTGGETKLTNTSLYSVIQTSIIRIYHCSKVSRTRHTSKETQTQHMTTARRRHCTKGNTNIDDWFTLQVARVTTVSTNKI
jgi:hypothetical protein